MKKVSQICVGVAALALAVTGGYFLGHRGADTVPGAHDGTPATVKPAKKLLYYRNPMGLPDTSPVPKKDPMGMDYIAVFEGEQAQDTGTANQIRISADKVQKMGVRTEAVQLRSMDRTVRAAGRVEPDERRIFMVAPKFEGYVERLHVNVSGQPVAKGQPLFEVYSPELVSVQREYAIAARVCSHCRAQTVRPSWAWRGWSNRACSGSRTGTSRKSRSRLWSRPARPSAA